MACDFAPSEVLPRRAVAAAGIIALHVLVAYPLATGLMHTILPAAEKPLMGMVIIEDRPRSPPQAPAPIDLKHTPMSVVPPELPERYVAQHVAPLSPAGPDSEAGSGVQTDSGPLPPMRVLGRNQLPDTEEFYPPELRRLGVEGATYVRVCVDGAGVRQGDPRIEQSSGNTRLDEGAVNVARHGRYARSVQGDAPVPNCYHFRIVFRIR
jgi:TonB family protein